MAFIPNNTNYVWLTPNGAGQAPMTKRLTDACPFDLVVVNLLPAGALAATCGTPAIDQGSITLGTPIVSAAASLYPDGSTGPAGAVLQIELSGGALPAGIASLQCTLSIPFTDTEGQTRTACAVINLTNQVSP